MCIFNKKKKTLEQRISNLENQVREILEMIQELYLNICETEQRLGKHLYEDRDLTEDDGTEWSEN